jgi:integrase
MTRRGQGEGSTDRFGEYYRHRITLPDGRRLALYARTREELNEKIETAIAARARGELVTSGRFPYGQWLDQWLADNVKPNLAITTWERYSGIVRNHVNPALGRLALDKVDAPRVQRLYAQMHDDGYRPATISTVHAVIHQSLEVARKMRLIGHNVADDVQGPPQRDRDASDRAFDSEQLRVLDEIMVGHRHEWLWRTMLLTGLRTGEATALTWKNVDIKNGRLYVRASYRRTLSGPLLATPKTKRGRRMIPLPRPAIRALEAQRARVREMKLACAVWQEQNLVFPNMLGRPLRPDRVLQEFQALLKRHGLPKKRLHDLRHTYATLLYAQDTHPRAVQELMGHSRLEMTMDLYTGSVSAVLENAAARLDGVFLERPSPAAGSDAEQQARMRADARRAAGGAGLTKQLG